MHSYQNEFPVSCQLHNLYIQTSLYQKDINVSCMSNDLLLISNPCHMQVAGKRHNPCKIATWTGYSNQSINLSNFWTSIKQTVIEIFIYCSRNAFSEKVYTIFIFFLIIMPFKLFKINIELIETITIVILLCVTCTALP